MNRFTRCAMLFTSLFVVLAVIGAADRQNHNQHAAGPAANTQWSTKTELNTLANAVNGRGVIGNC